VQRHGDRVLRGQVLGHVLEHVLRGELHLLEGTLVLRLLADEVVLTESLLGEPDHRVDYRDP
jgi:hypothetical protein